MAAGAVNTARQLGFAFGIAPLGSVFAARAQARARRPARARARPVSRRRWPAGRPRPCCAPRRQRRGRARRRAARRRGRRRAVGVPRRPASSACWPGSPCSRLVRPTKAPELGCTARDAADGARGTRCARASRPPQRLHSVRTAREAVHKLRADGRRARMPVVDSAADPRSAPTRSTPEDKRYDADVIVVGAGPSGSSAAYWLATAGLDVLLLEKTTFPREKVCGDGLTPRGTRALVDMGIDVSEEAGWLHNRGPARHRRRPAAAPGLARAHQLPALRPGPPARRPRRAAGPAGGQGRRAAARADHRHRADPRSRRPGRRRQRPHRRQAAASSTAPRSCSPARACRGKLAQRLGVHRNDKRPLGVAVRRYYTSPEDARRLPRVVARAVGRRARTSPNLLPGYGWIFGMGDGTVNAGLGVLNSSAGFQKTDYRAHAHPLARQHPGGVGAARGERHLPDPRRRRCRWASTAPRTTCAGCCSSATPAAR